MIVLKVKIGFKMHKDEIKLMFKMSRNKQEEKIHLQTIEKEQGEMGDSFSKKTSMFGIRNKHHNNMWTCNLHVLKMEVTCNKEQDMTL